MGEPTIEEIREARAKITQGRWHNEGRVIVDEHSIVVGDEAYNWRFVAHVNSDMEEGIAESPTVSEAEATANANFIANAPRYVDFLLAELQQRDEELKRLRAENADLDETVECLQSENESLRNELGGIYARELRAGRHK